ncbi:MAG: PDZ domain-containing protein [Planctomycetes bacterium]|nr:PDZ domain-containing protein [Planctomycetota bacterium]
MEVRSIGRIVQPVVIWLCVFGISELAAQPIADSNRGSRIARSVLEMGLETGGKADEEFTPEERINIAVYEKCNRSVVNITTRGTRAELFFLETETEGAGSGSILDDQGHLLTNFHVIDGAQKARVTLFNGASYEASLVGHDKANDIAVLRIAAPPEDLFPIEFGDSSRLRVGQRIYAIGNPFGLERTMTIGIVSSLNRSLGRSFRSMIQIDAALNRGNSGGPLLDSRGRLIGMNTAIASTTGENTGVGFAIPVATLSRVVPQLIANRRVIRPEIGIARVHESEQGLLIMKTTRGGPAERAGLQGYQEVVAQKRRGPFVYEERRMDGSRADLILAADGRRIRTADDLLSVIESKRPGDVVEIVAVRDGKERVVNVTLGASEP